MLLRFLSLLYVAAASTFAFSILASVTMKSNHFHTEHMQMQSPIDVFSTCFMHVFCNNSLK